MKIEDLSILYVEDEKELLEEVIEILQYKKIKHLHVAQNGFDALKIYEQEKPDLIITDLMMPKMSGIDLVSNIRSKDNDTKIIMLTAISDVDTLLRATELNLTKYILKPLQYENLFNAIDLALEQINRKLINNHKIDSNYTWDFNEKQLFYNNEEVKLTPKEKAILNLLLLNIDSTVIYDELVCKVWENSDLYSLDSLKTIVKTLRQKLPKNTIENVYGTGFKIVSTKKNC